MAGQTTLVLDTILTRIDSGAYLPGVALDEQGLASELGISRTPVREAFIWLEANGLIERGGRRGARLYRPSTDDFLRILEVHAQLEAQSAELAARRITAAQRNALADNLAASEEHLSQHSDREYAAYYQLNIQFHDIILDAAHNPYLGQLVRTQARKLMSYYRNRYRREGVTKASVAEHQKIAGLICAGDAAGVRAAMLAHFDYSLDTVMDILASSD